jgi:hypothetical protein
VINKFIDRDWVVEAEGVVNAWWLIEWFRVEHAL